MNLFKEGSLRSGLIVGKLHKLSSFLSRRNSKTRSLPSTFFYVSTHTPQAQNVSHKRETFLIAKYDSEVLLENSHLKATREACTDTQDTDDFK